MAGADPGGTSRGAAFRLLPSGMGAFIIGALDSSRHIDGRIFLTVFQSRIEGIVGYRKGENHRNDRNPGSRCLDCCIDFELL